MKINHLSTRNYIHTFTLNVNNRNLILCYNVYLLKDFNNSISLRFTRVRADIALIHHDEEIIYGCTACGKGQGTSLGIDLMSRSSPCHTTRARNTKRELLKKATTRETHGSTTCSAVVANRL